MNKPELLCPAGDLERLQMALHFGADAVYLAGAQFGMRAGAENFTPDASARPCSLRTCRRRRARDVQHSAAR